MPIYLYFKMKLLYFAVEVPGAECEIWKLCENGYEELSLNWWFFWIKSAKFNFLAIEYELKINIMLL